MFRRFQHIHFIGICGIGMSGIAEVLANLGFRVSGSDLKKSEVTAHLEELGVDFTEGHAAENVGDAHVVVRSTAVRDDNPEVIEARRRAIPLIPRAEMLAELMRMKPHTVAVADFVNKVPFYGAAVLCLDDPHVQAVIPKVERRRVTYGLSAQADISAHGISYDQSFGSSFTVWRGIDVLGSISLRVPGKHNVYNSLAAIAVGLELEVQFAKIAQELGEFSCADRRL